MAPVNQCHETHPSERVTGIEPVSQPWEGRVLPLNHTRRIRSKRNRRIRAAQLGARNTNFLFEARDPIFVIVDLGRIIDTLGQFPQPF